MNTIKTYCFVSLLVILALAGIVGPASGAYYKTAIFQVTNQVDQSSLWIKAPENNSELTINNTVTITVYPDQTSMVYSMAWGQQKILERNKMQDISFVVLSTDNSIYFSSEVRVIFTLTYRIVEDTSLPENADWLEYVRQQQEAQAKKYADLNSEPTSWIWSPPIVAIITLLITIATAILAFAFTRITKLVQVFNAGNLAWSGLCLFAFLVNLIYFAITAGTTNREMLAAWAWFSVRLVLILGLAIGWGGGFTGARFSFTIHHFWVVKQKSKQIVERVAVLYDNDEGKPCYALQSMWKAIKRWFGEHFRLVKLHDAGTVREDWTFVGEVGNEKIQFINDLEIDEELKCVKIDSTGETKHKVWDKVTKKLKVITRDFSNWAHVTGCNSQIKTDSQWILHCNALEELRAEYFTEYEDNIKLSQIELIGRNKEFKQHRKDFDRVLLEMRRPDLASKPQVAVMAGTGQAAAPTGADQVPPANPNAEVEDQRVNKGGN